MKAPESRVLTAVVAAVALLPGTAFAVCPASGVITRIEGRPQDVSISRTENGGPVTLSRPRILEVICPGDLIRVSNDTSLQLALDGRGQVQVGRGQTFTVPPRTGSTSMAGNAYRQIQDLILPDMRRQAWDVRLKGEEDTFGFALPSLAPGEQTLRPGTRDLVVRLAGGVGPYSVELADGNGRVVARATDVGLQVVLPQTVLTPGAYQIRARDSSPTAQTAQATVTVVPGPDRDREFAGIEDAEVRTAAAALALARANPAWSFEAEQMLHSAPRTGLDRARVYQLLESYSSPAPEQGSPPASPPAPPANNGN